MRGALVLALSTLTTASCATAPVSSTAVITRPVVCGGPAWQQMGAALATACVDSERARACHALQASWSTCPADIRPASRLRDHYTDELIVMVQDGGEWHGAVFDDASGVWVVVAFDGGDIP